MILANKLVCVSRKLLMSGLFLIKARAFLWRLHLFDEKSFITLASGSIFENIFFFVTDNAVK
jgi:hypothetical protein